jgi:hypothetical protein
MIATLMIGAAALDQGDSARHGGSFAGVNAAHQSGNIEGCGLAVQRHLNHAKFPSAVGHEETRPSMREPVGAKSRGS